MKKKYRVDDLVHNVRQTFGKSGLAIPNRGTDTIIDYPGFSITRNNAGYTILGKHEMVMAENINLSKTAILLANDLSLGRMINQKLLDTDKTVGYLQFEIESCQNSLEICTTRGEHDRAEWLAVKHDIASKKLAAAKANIDVLFNKLHARLNNLSTLEYKK